MFCESLTIAMSSFASSRISPSSSKLSSTLVLSVCLRSEVDVPFLRATMMDSSTMVVSDLLVDEERTPDLTCDVLDVELDDVLT